MKICETVWTINNEVEIGYKGILCWVVKTTADCIAFTEGKFLCAIFLDDPPQFAFVSQLDESVIGIEAMINRRKANSNGAKLSKLAHASLKVKRSNPGWPGDGIVPCHWDGIGVFALPLNIASDIAFVCNQVARKHQIHGVE